MKQTQSTFEVTDGLLMADDDNVISIHNARVVLTPLSEPYPAPAPAPAPAPLPRVKSRAERIADELCKTTILCFALYLLIEIFIAFNSGAFERLVRP